MTERQTMWMCGVVGIAGLIMAKTTYDYVAASIFVLMATYLALDRIKR